ncbi:MAG: tRNA (adenosine(37)-N6)-threonylcarbamoyltransferase complex dimerization subunit type 1 TsaB [Sphingobacteriales bacterium]|nr:tRNA (adenosine(37)-N6)-threonylcarbamoyltransferase complex dimerization subunit type 1 TsaB [Sphingobacteriales bacterium]
MSHILNIDTALERGSVCIAHEGKIFGLSVTENQKDHASWLHSAINELLQKNNLQAADISAVAVSIGPGSYTGLRVGLSAAKGFCYALNIPLITVNTLQLLAAGVKEEAKELIVPAIDARRMEIFTAVYDANLKEKTPPHSMIIDENSFEELFKSHSVLFCGNGIRKLKNIIKNNNASFSETMADAATLAGISYQLYLQKEFSDLAYTEPYYLKEFYSPAFKK